VKITDAKVGDVKVGDEFIYTAPSGREIVYTVDALAIATPQGQILPRSRSASGQVVFIHDELLAQDWWHRLASDEGERC
jgi:hypothetical protein